MNNFTSLTQRLDYHFTDLQLLERALTHRSFHGVNNERLEYLGDAVLGLVVAEELFHREPTASEGKLSRIRATLVNGDVLAELARQLRLNEHLRLGIGELKSGGKERQSILADAFEAVIGAIYVDGGMESARRCIMHWYKDRFEHLSTLTTIKDPKSLLQEWLQARKMPLPSYELVTKGKEHEPVFHVTARVSGIDFVTHGEGSSRRKAEQMSARFFLDKLHEQE